MSLTEPVILRLSLERMAYQIQQCLSPYEIDVRRHIEAAVKEAITHFDFEEEIRDQVRYTIDREVERRVSVAVHEALNRKNDPHLDQLIRTVVEERLAKMAQERE